MLPILTVPVHWRKFETLEFTLLLVLPGRGLRHTESESFLIVNFKWNSTFYLARDFLELRIQVHIHYKFTKNFYIHCNLLASLLLLGYEYQPGPFLLGCRYYYPAPLQQIVFSSITVFLPEYQDLTKILVSTRFLYGVITWFSTWFLTG